MREYISRFAGKSGQLFCEDWKVAAKSLTSLAFSKSCDRPHCPAGIFALAKLPCGICVMVKALELAHDKAEELRRIGIREGRRISLLRSDDPLVVSVENSRVAIGRRLARYIKVQTVSP